MKMSLNIACMLLFLSFMGCANIQKYIPFEGVKKSKKSFTIAWSKKFDPPYETGNLPVNITNPTIYEDILFHGDPIGNFTAYDIESGKVVWRVKEKGALGGRPAVYKGNIYYGGENGRLYVRTAFTGKLKYAIDLKAGIEQAPTFYKDRLFLHLRNHKVVCLDATTGKILWIYKRSVPYTTTIHRSSGVLVKNDKLFVGFADGFVGVFSIHNGEMLWEKKLSSGTKFIDVDATPIMIGNKLLVGSVAGKVNLMNPSNGVTTSVLDYNISRAPLAYKNMIFIVTVDGRLEILNDRYQVLEKFKVSDYPLTTPVIWNNSATFTDVVGNLYSLDLKELKIKKIKSFGNSNTSHYGSLEVYDKYLALSTSRNRLYVLKSH